MSHDHRNAYDVELGQLSPNGNGSFNGRTSDSFETKATSRLLHTAVIVEPHAPSERGEGGHPDSEEATEERLAPDPVTLILDIAWKSIHAGRIQDVQAYIDQYGFSFVIASDSDGDTPLHMAAGCGRTDIVSLLLQKSANINARNVKSETPLHAAILGGHNSTVKSLLSRSVVDITAKDTRRRSPLLLAVETQQADIVQSLIEAKANVNEGGAVVSSLSASPSSSKPSSTMTPLKTALRLKNAGIAKLLVGAGASVAAEVQPRTSPSSPLSSSSPAADWLPLHLAAAMGDVSLVSAMLVAKAELETKDHLGLRPLHAAAKACHAPVVRALLDAGALTDATLSLDGSNVVHWSAAFSTTDVLRVLLDHKMDPNVSDRNDAQPLHWAARQGKASNVSLLLERGASLITRNKRGQLPLDVAIEVAAEHVIELISAAMSKQQALMQQHLGAGPGSRARSAGGRAGTGGAGGGGGGGGASFALDASPITVVVESRSPSPTLSGVPKHPD